MSSVPATPSGADGTDGLPWPRRGWALVAQFMGITTAVLDGMVMNLALPRIAEDLLIDPATSTWIVNAYQVAIIAALLPAAALGQVIGYHRIYLGGLVLFSVMAVISATTREFETLLVARTLQGVSVACIASVNMAMLRHIVPASRFGRALGINSMMVALASTLGPTIAGAVLTVADWYWVFALCIPTAVASAAIGVFVFPDNDRAGARFDLPGAGLSALTFGAGLLAISGVGHGWPVWVIAATAALGVLAGVLAVRHMRGHAAPLLPVDLLRIPVVALSLTASCCAFSAQILVFVVLPFHFQGPMGLSPMEAGLVLSAWPLALAAVAPLSGGLADRLPAGLLGMSGLATVAAGLVAILLLPEGAGPMALAACLAVSGAGFVFFQTPNNRLAISMAPRARSSAATGSLGTARMLGQALGTALAAIALSGLLGEAATVAILMAAGLAATGAVVSLLRSG